MQKILYFIQRDYLRQYNRPLFNEDFEAWQYGPVVPAAYNRFSMFVAYPIRRTYNISLSSEDETFIRGRIPEYRRKSPWEMVEDTHKPGSARDRIWKAGKGYHQVIPQELIRIYGWYGKTDKAGGDPADIGKQVFQLSFSDTGHGGYSRYNKAAAIDRIPRRKAEGSVHRAQPVCPLCLPGKFELSVTPARSFLHDPLKVFQGCGFMKKKNEFYRKEYLENSNFSEHCVTPLRSINRDLKTSVFWGI